MANILWSDELLTGINQIDSQHRQLFVQVSRFLDDCDRGQGSERLAETLAFFEDYVLSHFASEEAIQRENRYPRLAEHLQQHAELIKELRGLRAELERDGVSVNLIGSAMQFWADWFLEHIAVSDKAIADFLHHTTDSNGTS